MSIILLFARYVAALLPSHLHSLAVRGFCFLFKRSLFGFTQKALKTALKSHARSVLYALKLTTARCAHEKSSCSQGLGLEQGAACHPPDPH